MQGAHAHAQGQGALAGGALKTAFGRLTPGRDQVLQRVEVQPRRNEQGVGTFGFKHMGFDSGD